MLFRSGSVPQYGRNVITNVLSNILGGYTNTIAGAGSVIVNGESNNITSDFGFIGSGAYNTILSPGDFSGIIAGNHNLISHQNSFILGSSLSSCAANFTFVNNISSQKTVAGDEAFFNSATVTNSLSVGGHIYGSAINWINLVTG